MLWHCTSCTTAYAVGLPACPHCRSTSIEEDGMPKITKAGGPSYEGHVDVSAPDTAAPEWAPADGPPAESEPVEPVERPELKPSPRRRAETTRKER